MQITHLPCALSWLGTLHSFSALMTTPVDLPLHAANHRASQCRLPASVASSIHSWVCRLQHSFPLGVHPIIPDNDASRGAFAIYWLAYSVRKSCLVHSPLWPCMPCRSKSLVIQFQSLLLFLLSYQLQGFHQGCNVFHSGLCEIVWFCQLCISYDYKPILLKRALCQIGVFPSHHGGCVQSTSFLWNAGLYPLTVDLLHPNVK
mmetsp:Transcript_35/g.53  ORF Transcript_35/g.53 Transcript_35/m.53 type:complete len:203 (-) Transcript_35:712-1320(-)